MRPTSVARPTRDGAPKEWERFIFYRGLGEAKLPLDVRARGEPVTVSATAPPGVRHLFVLRVEGGRGAYSYLPALAGQSIDLPAMDAALPIDRFVEKLGDDLAGRLVESGLYEKEARAMVNTWRSSYFHNRRPPHSVRAAAVVDRSVHPAEHRPGPGRSSASWSAAWSS